MKMCTYNQAPEPLYMSTQTVIIAICFGYLDFSIVE